jgi:hypothetical protein
LENQKTILQSRCGINITNIYFTKIRFEITVLNYHRGCSISAGTLATKTYVSLSLSLSLSLSHTHRVKSSLPLLDQPTTSANSKLFYKWWFTANQFSQLALLVISQHGPCREHRSSVAGQLLRSCEHVIATESLPSNGRCLYIFLLQDWTLPTDSSPN